MKAFNSKEARPHAGASSIHRPSTGAFNGNKEASFRKPFSKPGAYSGKPGQANNQQVGLRSRGTASETDSRQKHTTPAGAGTAPPASTASEMFTNDDETSAKPAKVKKPKAPKPPLDPNEHISQRAFIGGLSKDITSADVEGRFKSFGQLKDVYLAKDVDGTCRGFGYVTLDTTRKDWLKCVGLFNGAKWKGNVLKIEEANKDWQTRRQEDLEVQAKKDKREQDAGLKKIKRNPAKHAEDMALVTDKTMDGKRGWKRGRYGRPVITMKLDKMTYDPSHYKNNLEKLFNVPGRPLPLDKLIYEIDENEPLPKGKHLPTEVALAQFLAKPKQSSSNNPTEKSMPVMGGKGEALTSATTKVAAIVSEPMNRQPADEKVGNNNTSDDRAMMASILAGIDLSPRALSLDGSDIDDDDEGGYMENFGALPDTQADDLFGDIAMDNSAKTLSKSERDSKLEDLFGDDEDEDESRANQPSLDFLEDEEEYESDNDEEMKSEGEADSENGEDKEYDDGDDDDGMDDDTISAIAQLQGMSSTSAGGLFDSDDDQDTKSTFDAKLAEESNTARLKAMEARNAELEASREKQQQLIASTLANIDSRDKKEGHVVFSDSDDYDSEDFEKMEADHAKKISDMNKPPKSIFDSDSGSDEEDQPTPKVSKKRVGAKEMFGSDDEDEEPVLGKFGEPDLNIKEQFEGPGGKVLFKMQTKIGTSDSRFQLTKDFLDDRIRAEDDVDFVAHQERLKADEFASSSATGIVLDEDKQADSNISAEKMQAMNVLRAMFGDSVTRSKKKEEDTARQAKGGLGYTTGLAARYDPETAPPPPPPQSKPESPAEASKSTAFDSDSSSEVESQNQSSDKEEDEDVDEKEGDKMTEVVEDPQESKPAKKSVGFSFAFDTEVLNEKDTSSKSSSSATASVKKDLDTTPKFQVAGDLKSLFAPSTGTFKLFGGDDDEEDEKEGAGLGDVEDDRQMGAMDEDRPQDEILTSYSDGSRTIFASGADALARAPLSHSGSMFFFHFKNPSLLKRDEVIAHWEKTRHTMTQEFKRKHKSASRNKARASKRFKAGAEGGSSLGDHP
ncbi:nucleolar protein 8 [Mortierella sp. AM989]|nr:nucleolar protein 8 [Mortierella sp. AM989]